MEEQKLEGGSITSPVKVGDTVRRRVTPATPAIHALLRHLEAQGFAGVPRVLGMDSRGREILSFVEGETIGGREPWPDWAFADETIVQVGRWMRAFHEVTRSFAAREGMVIAHNDAAPTNAVWRDGSLVGFVDFDLAGLAKVEDDLAFTALSWVPLDAPQPADSSGRQRRLNLLLNSYGYLGDRIAFGTTVVQRARLNANGIRALAVTGDPTYLALLPAAAALERTAAELEALPPSFWQ